MGRSTGAWAPRSDHARVRENERKRRMRKAAAEAACAEVQAAADAMETVIEGAMITSADSVEEDQSGGDNKENDSVDEVVGSKRGRKHTPWSQLSARSKRRRRGSLKEVLLTINDEAIAEVLVTDRPGVVLEAVKMGQGAQRKAVLDACVGKKLTGRECVTMADRCDMTHAQYQMCRNESAGFSQQTVNRNAMAKAKAEWNDELERDLGVKEVSARGLSGAYLDLVKALEFVLQQIESTGRRVHFTNDKLRVKVMVDARPETFGKKRSSTLVGIQLLDLDLVLGSSSTVFPVGIFQCGEDRERLKTAAPELWETMRCLVAGKKLLWREESVEVEILLGLDLAATWHMLDFRRGDCPYCMCDVKKRKRMEKCEKRTQYGSNTAIPGLNADCFVFCTLHMLLRVMESLIERLFDKGYHVYLTKTGKIKSATRLAQMQALLARLHLNFSVTKANDETQLDIQGMDGATGRKVLDAAEKLVPEMDEDPITLQIWIQFRSLIDFLNHGTPLQVSEGTCTVKSVADFREKAEAWGLLLKERYTMDIIRIYPHILICHAAEVFEKYGPLASIANQAFEARHSKDRMEFSRHTPHGGRVGRTRKEVNVSKLMILNAYRKAEPAQWFKQSKKSKEKRAQYEAPMV